MIVMVWLLDRRKFFNRFMCERGFYRLKMEKTAVPAVTYRKDFVFHYSVTFNFRRVILCDCNGLVT